MSSKSTENNTYAAKRPFIRKKGVKDLSVKSIGTPVPLPAKMPSNVFCEHPILIENLCGRRKAIFSTGFSMSADILPDKNMLRDKAVFDMDSVRLSSYQDIFEKDRFPEITNFDPDHRYFWHRCYYGILSTEHGVNPFTGEECIIGAMHGENKNGSYCFPPRYITTTVLPEGTFSQPEDGTLPMPEDYSLDKVYFAFVGLTYLNASELSDADFMKHDLGPVVWPSNGYLDKKNNRTSLGVSHPYLIRHDGYLYLFYSEELYGDISAEEGRGVGIKVARAPETDWKPGNFRTWYNGSFSEDSLPEGFDRFDRRFFYEKGGRSSPVIVHPNGYNVNYFSVARIKGTNLFLGISWDRIQNSWLWLSEDLVNWHMSLQMPDFGWAAFCYPAFYNDDFTSQKEIDINNFYIAGTNLQKEPITHVISVSLSIK